ncbi:MAG: hypothetical protein Q4G59_06555 [Planctomycetia bacterium]|nr:hypothetical protein [Planctomycetia bacterium]
MRYKLLILVLILVVSTGASPFRARSNNMNLNNNLYPGVTGPGPGVVPMQGPMSGMNGNCPGMDKFGMGGAYGTREVVQLAFQGANGMYVNWDTIQYGGFESAPLVCPGIQNFDAGKVYRLKLSHIKNRESLILYPTIQVNAVIPRTKSYLDHNAIPVVFTDNDFDQVQQGNFVTKVIFLPAPEFQNLAVSGGVDTIVNSQLPAGADPVVEAQNRGSILAVVRIGNKNLDQPGTRPEDMVEEEVSGRPRVPAIPISGVNVPAFGTPNSTTPYGVPGPAVLPAPGAVSRQRAFAPVNVYPSTEVPQVSPRWGGDNF